MISRSETNWTWNEEPAPIVFQSAMTAPVVEEILAKGRSDLPEYKESAAVHLNILKSVGSFLTAHGIASDDFPFT